MPRILRKLNPPTHNDYKRYKPYLWLEFEASCAYCHVPESRNGPMGNFHVDHFRPKSRPEFVELVCSYSNLYLACADCNRNKKGTWPEPGTETVGGRFLDPCEDDLSKHWSIQKDGSFTPTTPEGGYMIAKLRLNRTYLLEWRRGKTHLLGEVSRLTELISKVTPGTEWHSELLQLRAEAEGWLYDEFGDFWQ